jgi:hypothetical protein
MEGLISADETMRRPAAAAGIPEHHRTRIGAGAHAVGVSILSAHLRLMNGSLKKAVSCPGRGHWCRTIRSNLKVPGSAADPT